MGRTLMFALDRGGRSRRSAGVLRIDRRPSPYTSSFALEEIDVVFANGSTAALVMKDLGPDAMVASARRARPEFLYEPRREIQTYRHILPYSPAGTAACYAALDEPEAGRYRLLLERIDGHELRHVGAFSMWQRTARWIARFHTSVPPTDLDRLARRARLLVYDEAFYWQWLDRARRFTAQAERRKNAATRRALDRIARGYTAVVARLAAMPRIIIHGEFYPCNVLIRGTGPHARVCPVDWELTALGPGLIDLAALITGWDDRAQRALLRAYVAGSRDGNGDGDRAGDNGGALRPRRITRELQRDLDCCRLHLAVRMLGWSDTWTPPPQHARDWLAEAVSLATRLEA